MELGLSDLLQAKESRSSVAPNSFGKAKSRILLYLYGLPSQLETFDVKPNAPLEIRGELNSIPSVLPGYHICELLPEYGERPDQAQIQTNGNVYMKEQFPNLDFIKKATIIKLKKK